MKETAEIRILQGQAVQLSVNAYAPAIDPVIVRASS
jgi:hypothetical protein